jgi:hypothetical protein
VLNILMTTVTWVFIDARTEAPGWCEGQNRGFAAICSLENGSWLFLQAEAKEGSWKVGIEYRGEDEVTTRCFIDT